VVVGAAVSAGVGLAVQARLNGELGARLGDGIAASLASTTAGMAVLLALVLTLPSGRRGLGLPSRVGGALVCVAAVAVAVHDRLGGHGALVLVVLPVVAGIAVAIQSALNGRVGAAAGSPWPATLVNFAVAALTLAVALLVELSVRGVPSGKLTGAPWLYAAGLIGIVVTLAAVMLTARPPR
jgi:transporter family-2 protein